MRLSSISQGTHSWIRWRRRRHTLVTSDAGTADVIWSWLNCGSTGAAEKYQTLKVRNVSDGETDESTHRLSLLRVSNLGVESDFDCH